MIFQEPMTSLNPLHTVEKQVAETLLIHNHLPAATVRRRTLELLHLVGLREAESRLSAIRTSSRAAAPAGDDRDGDRQRADILIADEPTTALDVTIQAQISN